MSMTRVDEADAGRMRAAVLGHGGAISVESWPVPEVGPDDVLIEVSHCGVCGTDLHDVVDGWGRPGNVNGHEYSGRSWRVGDEVRHWSIGDLVVGGPSPGCGTCPSCLAGRPAVCLQRNQPGTGRFQGAFAEYVRIPGPGPRRPARSPSACRGAGRAAGRGAPCDHRQPALPRRGCGGLRRRTHRRADHRRPRRTRHAHGHGRRAGRPPPGARGGARRRPHRASRCDLDVPSIAEPMRIVEGAVDVVFECSGRRAAMEGALAQLAPRRHAHDRGGRYGPTALRLEPDPAQRARGDPGRSTTTPGASRRPGAPRVGRAPVER